jgi:hypothetical protein
MGHRLRSEKDKETRGIASKGSKEVRTRGISREQLDEYCNRNRHPGSSISSVCVEEMEEEEFTFNVPSPFDLEFGWLVAASPIIRSRRLNYQKLLKYCLRHRDPGCAGSDATLYISLELEEFHIPSPFDPAFVELVEAEKKTKKQIMKVHKMAARKSAAKTSFFDKLRAYGKESVLKRRAAKRGIKRIPAGLQFPSPEFASKFESVNPFDERFPNGGTPRQKSFTLLPETPAHHSANLAPARLTTNVKDEDRLGFTVVSPFDERFPGYAFESKMTWKTEANVLPTLQTIAELPGGMLYGGSRVTDPFPALTPVSLKNTRKGVVGFGLPNSRTSSPVVSPRVPKKKGEPIFAK